MIQLGNLRAGRDLRAILQCLDGPNDYYLLAHDFVSYLDAQERVDATYKNPALWNRMSILSTYGAAHRRARLLLLLRGHDDDDDDDDDGRMLTLWWAGICGADSVVQGGHGFFSSDRTIKEYARDIWGVQACRRPGPMPVPLERLSSKGVIGRDVLSPMNRFGAVAGDSFIPLEQFSPQ